jgi:hypothetical protein
VERISEGECCRAGQIIRLMFCICPRFRPGGGGLGSFTLVPARFPGSEGVGEKKLLKNSSARDMD